jgi:hypothetical protein
VLVTLRCQSQAAQILRNYGLTRLFSGIYGSSDRNAAYQNQAELKTQLLEKALVNNLLLAEASSISLDGGRYRSRPLGRTGALNSYYCSYLRHSLSLLPQAIPANSHPRVTCLLLLITY